MPTYVKRPIAVEAFELENLKDARTRNAPPAWFVRAIACGDVVIESDASINIKTLEGVMRANVGDFIIQGVKKEIYPCRADIFRATYERQPEIATQGECK